MRTRYVKVEAQVNLCITYNDHIIPDEHCDKELFFYARVPSTSPAYIERLITSLVLKEEQNMIFGKLKSVTVNDFKVQNAYDARK